METVSSGGRSSLGEVVPVDLFTSREKERAHEHLGNEKNLKWPLARRDTDLNNVTTGRAPRRRSRPELGEKMKSQRLGGLEGVLGSAIGGEVPSGDVGALGWLGKGMRRVNLWAR
jgi:hypothetical protein